MSYRFPGTSPERSASMKAVRRVGTRPELKVRRALSDLGVRYRLNVKDLPGSPDLVNKSQRFAIFVNGCFWHRHRNCTKATTPRKNRAYWLAKFKSNVARDRKNRRALQKMGFAVCIVWECQTKNLQKLRHKLKRFLDATVSG